VDLSQTVIFLTSNLGAQIADLMNGGMGSSSEGQGQRIARESAEDRGGSGEADFSPEFMIAWTNRGVHPLKREDWMKCMEIELRQVQKRVLDRTTRPLLLSNHGRSRESCCKKEPTSVWMRAT